MLRIALCDDEAKARDVLHIELEKILIEGTEEIVYEFSSGTLAVSWIKKHPGEVDLLFLDVEMDGLSGMETAARIRQSDSQIMIVFVTGYTDYVFDGYQVGALDYILKPVSSQKLRELLARVRTKLEKEKSQTFLLKNINGTWRFRLCDILYFYSDRRQVILVAGHGEYPFYAKLDEVEAQLAPRFIRIHQRYLINPAQVDYIGSETLTLGGAQLPCSRKYRESAMGRIARFMMGGGVE
ncbi:MAG: LytTR family DNA-binding domain-containing protein [Lachnospiraceae bacterium]|nr:LytTR family DNA-binding domain-containing protein [Lachnospiraceae bacterium]